MIDWSNGYEGVAVDFFGWARALTRRRSWSECRSQVARTLARGASVIDVGCGPGFPITEVLVAEGLNGFAVDAARSFVEAFRRNFPEVPAACEAVQDSRFFGRIFDAVLAWDSSSCFPLKSGT